MSGVADGDGRGMRVIPLGRARHQAGRRLTSPDEERYGLRRKLIALYRDDKRYQHIIQQDIRPRWDRLTRVCDVQALADAAEAANPQTISRHFESIRLPGHRLPQHLRQRDEPWPSHPIYFRHLEAARGQNPYLDEYINAVYERGVRPLALLSAGRPAPWAAGFLHASATGDEYRNDPALDPEDHLTDEHDVSAALEFWITPDIATTNFVVEPGWDAVARAICWERVGEDPENADPPLPQPRVDLNRLPGWVSESPHRMRSGGAGKGYIVDDDTLRWLEEGAIEQVRQFFAAVRAWRQEHFAHRNVARTIVERQQQDLSLLYRHLFHSTPIPPDEATRRRLRELAHIIDVDFPKATKKRRKTAPKVP